MAGHSHSANIWGTKSVQDAKRSKLFTRLSKDIVNAVRIGKSIDPALNPILRSALDKAKAANIPSDRIQKAIDKASGKSEDKDLTQSKIYEVLSPNNNYILIEAETDNPTRTIAEVKLVVSKAGFKVLEPGSALRFFEEVGEVILQLNPSFNEYPIDNIISTSGIIDYIETSNEFRLFISKDSFQDALQEISKWSSVNIKNAEIILRNKIVTNINQENLNILKEFESKLLDLDDIVKVWW